LKLELEDGWAIEKYHDSYLVCNCTTAGWIALWCPKLKRFWCIGCEKVASDYICLVASLMFVRTDEWPKNET